MSSNTRTTTIVKGTGGSRRTQTSEEVIIVAGVQGPAGSGTIDHTALENRDAPSQHPASSIDYTPEGGGATIPVGQKIDQLVAEDADLQAQITAHLNDPADAHDASAISFTPQGLLEADDVEEALVELDHEKVPVTRSIGTSAPLSGGGALSGDLSLEVADATAGGPIDDGARGTVPAPPSVGDEGDFRAVLVNNSGGARPLWAQVGNGLGVSGGEISVLTDELNHGDLADLEVPGDHPMYRRKHGHAVNTDGTRQATLSYSVLTRRVTFTPNGTATFWVNGVKFTKSVPVDSPQHDVAQGKYFFYFDANGDFQVSSVNNAWSILDLTVIPTAMVYFDANNVEGVCFNELHGADRDLGLHYNLHFAQGTRLVSGASLSGHTPGTDSDAAVTFSVSETKVADEDLPTTIPTLADGGPYKIWYRTGANGDWTWVSKSLPFDYGTYARYNRWTGATWTVTDISGNPSRWVNYYLVAIPAVSPSGFGFGLIMGQAEHATLAAAQGASLASNSLGTLPFEEIAPLYKLTFQAGQAFGGTAKMKLVEVTSIVAQGASVTGSTTAPSIHNALSGRSAADAHPASAITNTPAGNIAATDVQAAINELDSEKAAASALSGYVPTSRTISTTAPLSGGGDLSSNRTLDISDATAAGALAGGAKGAVPASSQLGDEGEGKALLSSNNGAGGLWAGLGGEKPLLGATISSRMSMGSGVVVIHPPWRAGCNVPSPVASKFWHVFRAPVAMKVIQIYALHEGGTSCGINVRKNGASDLLAADYTTTTSWASAGTVQNGSLGAGDYLEVEIAAVSGSVNQVAVQIDMVENG